MSRTRFIPMQLIVFAVFGCIFAASARAAIEGAATLTGVQGEVLVQKSGGGEWSPGKEGMVLRTGDRVKTGAKASCAIKWYRGNTMKLTAFTAVTIDKLQKNPAAGAESTSVGLWSGKVYAQAKPLGGAGSKFEVKTPSAVAGVRGTKMSVGLGADDKTSIECLEGSVSVTSIAGGEVMLNKGQKTQVEKDKPPEQPTQMQPDEVKEFDSLTQAAGAMLEIIQPVGDLVADTSPITVKGKTDPGNTVTVNGKTVVADQSGAFTASVNLTEGTNQIKIDAANKQGNVTTSTRVIKYNPSGAQDATGNGAENAINLVVNSPEEGRVTRDSNVKVAGTAKPGTDLTINGMQAPVSPGSGVFSASVPLIEGDNVITVTGRKGANVMTVTRTVTRDTLPPRLIMTQPAVSTFSGDTPGCKPGYGNSITCDLIGQTEFGVTLTANDMQCRVETDGTFGSSPNECRVTVGPGLNSINVAATDKAGNRTTMLLSRIFDRTKLSSMTISVSPAAVVANLQNTVIVTVNTYNFMNEPVDAQVTLTVTGNTGTLMPTTVTTQNGIGTAVYTTGLVSQPLVITFNATGSGNITANPPAVLTLLPDIPPSPIR